MCVCMCVVSVQFQSRPLTLQLSLQQGCEEGLQSQSHLSFVEVRQFVVLSGVFKVLSESTLNWTAFKVMLLSPQFEICGNTSYISV